MSDQPINNDEALAELAWLRTHCVAVLRDETEVVNLSECAARVHEYQARIVHTDAVLAKLRGYVQHKPNCRQFYNYDGQCGNPLQAGTRCRLAHGHSGEHANGSMLWDEGGCTCGLDALLNGEAK